MNDHPGDRWTPLLQTANFLGAIVGYSLAYLVVVAVCFGAARLIGLI